MPPTRDVVESVAEYVDLLGSKFAYDDLVFRGQREPWPLVPKLGRIELNDDRTLRAVEIDLMDSFKRQSLPYLDRVPADDFGWLALAQHHGLPTRLLDWTTNALAALWFAVSEPATSDKSGVVYVQAVDAADFVGPRDLKPFALPKTMFFRPHHVTHRIAAQSGWLSIHRLLGRGFVALERNKNFKDWISKILIPPEAFGGIRWTLDAFGVNRATMFGDLQALCRHLEWKASMTPDERDL